MDKIPPATRSRIMAQVRSRGNRSTELALIRILRRYRITGWRRGVPLEGKPDFVFSESRTIVFVDGCFWHGCPQHCRLPSIRYNYWKSKIEANVIRDRKVSRTLRETGWTVLRFWEHELTNGKETRKARRLKTLV